ncbi:MAG: hypothetical protein JO323_09940 [Acidobacteriia bacterium]|nr:hypothetical protein [Terriglobia bacterium]
MRIRINVDRPAAPGTHRLRYSEDRDPPGALAVNAPQAHPGDFSHRFPKNANIAWVPVTAGHTVTIDFGVSTAAQCPFKWTSGQWSPPGQATFPNANGNAVLNDGWTSRASGIKYSVTLSDTSGPITDDPEVIIEDDGG